MIPASVYAYITLKVADEITLDETWRKFAGTTEAKVDKFKPSVIGLFKKQEADVIKRLNAMALPKGHIKAIEDDWLNRLFQIHEWGWAFETMERPFVGDALQAGVDELGRSIGMEIAFDLDNPRVRDLIDKKVHKFSFEVNSTTNAALKRELAAALQAGESIPKIRNRVKHVFNIAKTSQADNIARTEIIGTYNKGTQEGMVASGVVKTKIWLATRDQRTRDSHRSIDGEEVAVEAKFSNGLMHPGDWNGRPGEICNCRCTTIAGEFN